VFISHASAGPAHLKQRGRSPGEELGMIVFTGDLGNVLDIALGLFLGCQGNDSNSASFGSMEIIFNRNALMLKALSLIFLYLCIEEYNRGEGYSHSPYRF
jgi:hypothetical protein